MGAIFTLLKILVHIFSFVKQIPFAIKQARNGGHRAERAQLHNSWLLIDDGLVKSPKNGILFISPLIISIGYKDDFW